jgi:4-amino-4-deoxy-L-arabinose transferase-like glycosyltransferase
MRRLLLLLAVVTYAALATARARADRPVVDEAWFGSPALNLAVHGSMHTSILESNGTFFEGLDRYTYWIMPAYPVALAAWFSATGPGLTQMRVMSVFFGCALILAIYLLVRRLVDVQSAMLTAWLVALDFTVVRAGAVGRMDGMCAAFGFAGLAVYCSLRQRHSGIAFVAGHAFAALALMTHPNGVLYAGGLTLIAFWSGRDKPRLSHFAGAALPYVVLLAAWGLYLANDFALFQRQFGGNAANRFSGILDPVTALWQEVSVRYLAGGQTMLRVALLVPYLLGLAAAIVIGPLRRHPGVRTLLLLSALFFLYQWLFEAVKLHFYVVHLAPLWMSLFAIALRWTWGRHKRLRLPTVLLAALLIVVHLAGTAYTIRRNSYARTYVQVLEAIRSHADRTDLIMGSAELAFALGFDANLVDDVRLGCHSGKQPAVVVVDRRYRDTFAVVLAVKEPDAYRHVQKMLDRGHQVATVDDYQIYVFH